MKLIAIAGRKGAGKDTFALPLLVENEGSFNLLKFADPLKNMIRSLLRDAGVPTNEIESLVEGSLKEKPQAVLGGKTTRLAMQTLGTEWRDLIDVNLWTNITHSRLTNMARQGARGAIITDCRFQHEIELIHQLGGKVFRIHGRTEPNSFSDHPSEAGIDSLPVDGEIFNYGSILHLHAHAIMLADKLDNCNI